MGLNRPVGCGPVNGLEMPIMIDGGKKRGRITLETVRERIKWRAFWGLTAFVVRGFEGVEFEWGIIEPVDVDSSNQDSNNSTVNTMTTQDVYKSRRNRTAST